MNLPRPIIWGLTIIYLVSFACFFALGLLAWSNGGYTHEYELFGIAAPRILAMLLVVMAVSASLSWLHYRGESYTAFEETFYGVLLGISVFGLTLSIPLVLATSG
jgi:hypothetical protein